MWRGELLDGPVLPDRKLASGARAWLTEVLTEQRVVNAAATAQIASAPDADLVRMEQTWLVAHFLQHRESAAAICVPLTDGRVPDDLDPRLAAELEHRRAGHDRP